MEKENKKLKKLLKELMKIIDRASMFGLDQEEAQKWYTKVYKTLGEDYALK